MALSLLAPISDVNYTLFVDRQESVLQSRVLFESGGSMVVGLINLNVGGDPKCIPETAVLQVLWLGLGWCGADINHSTTRLSSMIFFAMQNANVDIQTVPIVPAMDATVVQGPKPDAGNGMDVQTDLMTSRIYSRLVGNTSSSVCGVCGCSHGNCMY